MDFYRITNRVGVEVIPYTCQTWHTLNMEKLYSIERGEFFWTEKEGVSPKVITIQTEHGRADVQQIEKLQCSVSSEPIYVADVKWALVNVGSSPFRISFPEGEIRSGCLVIVYKSPFIPVSTICMTYGGRGEYDFPNTPVSSTNREGILTFIETKREDWQPFVVEFGEREESLRPVFIHSKPIGESIQYVETDISTALQHGQVGSVMKTNLSENKAFLTILQVRSPEPILDMFQTTDKEGVKVGETLSYSVHIVSRGSLAAEHIQFLTNIPEGTRLLLETVRINGMAIPQDPSKPLILRNMPVNDYLLIKYTVYVERTPKDRVLYHQPVLDYDFYPVRSIPQIGNQPCRNCMATRVVDPSSD